MTEFLTIFFAVFAVTLIYNAIKMKSSREIPKMVVSARIDLEKAIDKEGFIDYMFPRLIFLGVAIFVFSVFALLSGYLGLNAYISFISDMAFFVIIIVFGVITVKAQDKYLLGR